MSENGNGHHNGGLNGFAGSRWDRLPDDLPVEELAPIEEEEDLTPEERMRQRSRETALRLMQEGRFSTPEQRRAGGLARQEQRRARRKPLQEIMADLSRDNAPEIFGRLMKTVRDGNDRDVNGAVQLLMNATEWRERTLREDEGELAKLTGRPLQEALISALAEVSGRDVAEIEAMAGVGAKSNDGEDVIEAEVVDDGNDS